MSRLDHSGNKIFTLGELRQNIGLFFNNVQWYHHPDGEVMRLNKIGKTINRLTCCVLLSKRHGRTISVWLPDYTEFFTKNDRNAVDSE